MSQQYIIRLRSKDGTFRFPITLGVTTIGDAKRFFSEQTKIDSDMLSISLANSKAMGIASGSIKGSAKGSTKSTQFNADSLIISNIPNIQNGEMFEVTYFSGLQSIQDKENEEKKKQRESEMHPDDINKMGLRHIKKNWTLNDYIQEVNKKKIVIKTQKYPVCSLCAIDKNAAQMFQIYLREMAFQVQRMGYLLGEAVPGVKPNRDQDESSDSSDDESDSKTSTLMDTTKHDFKALQCAVIYEPPQSGDVGGVIELNDPLETRVDQLSSLLGMHRVGWIFSHNGQNRPHSLINEDILKMAKMQSKYGEKFVTVVVSPNEKFQAKFEAFQVSKQCVSLYEKGLLEIDSEKPNILKCKVPVECERKIINEIDILMFIVNVPIQNTTSRFHVGFPPNNRFDQPQSLSKVKELLLKRPGLFVEKVTDFHLLLFMSEYLSLSSDFPVLCDAIKTKNDSKAKDIQFLFEAYTGLH